MTWNIIAGYQNNSDGERVIAPVMRWSDLAFIRALGLDKFMNRPTAAQRAVGITEEDLRHGQR